METLFGEFGVNGDLIVLFVLSHVEVAILHGEVFPPGTLSYLEGNCQWKLLFV